MEKGMEGSGRGLIEILLQHFSGGMKTAKDLGQSSRCSGRDPNKNPAEYKLQMVRLEPT
jgi:hypothetical protein